MVKFYAIGILVSRVLLEILCSGVIFSVKRRATYLLVYLTVVLKGGWTVCEGWIRETELKQFVCKQSSKQFSNSADTQHFSEDGHPSPSPVVMTVNSPSARMDLGR
jgi:hypothetical protein